MHDSEKKRAMCSVMEVYHLASGRWEQKPTTGTPPLGVMVMQLLLLEMRYSIMVAIVIMLAVTIIVCTVLMLIPSTGRNSLLLLLTMVL